MSCKIIRRFGRPVVWLTLSLGCVGSAGARPPDGPLDPAISDWFKSLKQPETQMSCCSVADCRRMPYHIQDGHYEVDIEGFRYVVPDGTVLQGVDNPTDQSVVCYSLLGPREAR